MKGKDRRRKVIGGLKQGKIVKGIGGFYYVQDGASAVHECKARGIFRKDQVTPLVGDVVLFSEETGQGYGLIEQIKPRKNELVRPAVANIDVLLLVVSADRPRVDTLLCDKLLVQAEHKGIETYFCINKIDVDQEIIDSLGSQYAAYRQFYTSAKTGEGLEGLKAAIKEKCVCLAGQSAVGKSSLINALEPGMELQTGGMSKKTSRGKHTTRQAELLFLPGADAFIVDTPGFSMFEIADLNRQEVAAGYREFAPYAVKCRFSGCMHLSEPDCMVKKAVEQGKIDRARWARYVKIIEEKDGQKPRYGDKK